MDDKLDATDLPEWSWYRGHSGAWPLPFTHIAPGGVPGGHSVDDEPEALPAAAPATSTNDSRSRVAAMIRLYDLRGGCESPPLSSSSAPGAWFLACLERMASASSGIVAPYISVVKFAFE